jgi:hypothetical protein
MAWFADLSPCTYFPGPFADCLVAVGWLESGQPYPTGFVDRRVYDKLIELFRKPWQPVYCMGPHICDLCNYEGAFSHKNLFVPHGDITLVAPELITHYMNAHSYCPPDEFCEAVMACPPMSTADYFRAMKRAAKSYFAAPPTE